MVKLQSRIPEGPLAEKWSNYKSNQNLVNPANKRKLDVIVIGTGLAGASAAASLAEMGFKVKSFCYQDSPEGPIASRHREGPMLQRTTRMTVTASTGSSSIPSRAVITAPVKPTCTALPR